MFLKSLLICKQNTKQRLHELIELGKISSREYYNLYLLLLQLNKMTDYVANGAWGGEKIRTALVYWVESNYNNKQTSVQFNLTENALIDMLKQADKLISKKLERPLQQMLNGNMYDGVVNFYNNTSTIEVNKNIKRGNKNGR